MNFFPPQTTFNPSCHNYHITEISWPSDHILSFPRMPSLTTFPEIPHDRLPVSLDLSFDTSRFELACHDDKDTIRAKVNLNEFEITFILTRHTCEVSILSRCPQTPFLPPASKTGHDDTWRRRFSFSSVNIYSKLTGLLKYLENVKDEFSVFVLRNHLEEFLKGYRPGRHHFVHKHIHGGWIRTSDQNMSRVGGLCFGFKSLGLNAMF